MDQPLCKLSLVCPAASAEPIIELMLSMPQPVTGFTTWQAEGHGFGFETASVGERVKGRREQTVLVMILKENDAQRLLTDIRIAVPVAHMTYWTEPVTAFGHLSVDQSSRPDASRRNPLNNEVETPDFASV